MKFFPAPARTVSERPPLGKPAAHDGRMICHRRGPAEDPVQLPAADDRPSATTHQLPAPDLCVRT